MHCLGVSCRQHSLLGARWHININRSTPSLHHAPPRQRSDRITPDQTKPGTTPYTLFAHSLRPVCALLQCRCHAATTRNIGLRYTQARPPIPPQGPVSILYIGACIKSLNLRISLFKVSMRMDDFTLFQTLYPSRGFVFFTIIHIGIVNFQISIFRFFRIQDCGLTLTQMGQSCQRKAPQIRSNRQNPPFCISDFSCFSLR